MADEQRLHLIREFGYKGPDKEDKQEKHEISHGNGFHIGMGHGKQSDIDSKSSGSADAEMIFMREGGPRKDADEAITNGGENDDGERNRDYAELGQEEARGAEPAATARSPRGRT